MESQRRASDSEAKAAAKLRQPLQDVIEIQLEFARPMFFTSDAQAMNMVIVPAERIMILIGPFLSLSHGTQLTSRSRRAGCTSVASRSNGSVLVGSQTRRERRNP